MAQPLSRLELERQRRIEENKRRMAEMGVAEAAQGLLASQQAARASQQAPRLKRKYEVFTICAEDLRRSVRSKKDVNYNEQDTWKAEEALARAEARSRLVTTRRVKCCQDESGEVVRVSKRDGWLPAMGCAGYEACEKCLDAAQQHADGLSNPAVCKGLSASMVSGGFWCNAPSGLMSLVKVPDKCRLAAYLAQQHEAPEGAEYSEQDDDGGQFWGMVWLPRKVGCGFSGGWRGFALDLKLFPGDVVVMETVPPAQHTASTARFSLIMHIFRALDFESKSAKEARLKAGVASAGSLGEEEVGDGEETAEGTVNRQQQRQGEGGAEPAMPAMHPDVPAAAAVTAQQDEGSAEPAVAAAVAELSEQRQPGQQADQAGQEGIAGEETVEMPAPAGGKSGRGRRQRQAKLAPATADGGKHQKTTAAGSKAIKTAKPASGRTAKAVTGSKHTKGGVSNKKDAAGGKSGAVAGAKQGGRAKGVGAKKQEKEQERGELAKKPVQQAGKKAAEKPGNQEGEEALEEVYEVECILAARKQGRSQEYHIKWMGYEAPTWEPATMLDQPLHTYKLAPGFVVP